MADVTGDEASAARAPADRVPDAAGYPSAWEADVVLQDGTTTHVRPIRPDDSDALQAFHIGQSERSTYLRFFAPLARLPERDLARLVTVDHVDRVALVAVAAGLDGTEQIIGVARYDRIGADEAEVAFNVSDAHQGRGLGSVLLEHLAAAARERGVRRFVAEVLPQNGRMIAVFKDAGYVVRQRTEDGIVAVGFDIDPTDRSLAVMADREHRAEASSVRAFLRARSVLVVGPGDGASPLADVAAVALENVRRGDAEISVHAVGVADEVVDVHVYDSVDLVAGPVELAIVAVDPADAVGVVRALARLGVRAVVLLSAGFAELGPEGLDRQRALLRVAHAAGIRVIGPASYGVLVASGDGWLNASLAAQPPEQGRVGLFCQSAPLAVSLLGAARRRGLGLAEFVSAGHRADVSGNDLMQFWADDGGTDVVGLYLESIGNPRKFSRVARRLSLTKPVVVVTTGRSGQVVPPGHAVRPTLASPRTLDEMLRQADVIRVDNTHQLLDVVEVFAHQPLPTGRRVAILASSQSLAALVAEAAAAAGLVVPGAVTIVPPGAGGEDVAAQVDALYSDPACDVVLVVLVPTIGLPDPALATAVAAAAARTGRTTAACVLGLHGITPELTAADAAGRQRTVPAYSAPEDAALALGRAARYASRRVRDRGNALHPDGVDLRGARRLVAGWLAPGQESVTLDAEQTAALLATVGVAVLPSFAVRDADEAVEVARRIGWPVAIKTTLPTLRHRADLGGVRLDIDDEAALRVDAAHVLALAATQSAEPGDLPLEVQAMAPRGSACVIRTVEDPLFGPIVSFGLAGDASDLLGDVSYGVPPLTDVDVAELVRSARAAPRLFGYRGLPPLDVSALEDVIARVAVLCDDLPELRSLELNPVVVAEQGAVVLGARATVAPADRADTTRRLQRV
jgi:acyl-CoA synthetase (NDP forming)/RimJ/RimL family protein N-acetyltransferase